jgi:DNA-directed RNA polymerase specialized sigma24 family protein
MVAPSTIGRIACAALPPRHGAPEVIDPVPKKWSLTKEGFDRLLSCLDPDRESAGRKYELIRSKLISYFDWRDCPFPEEHADEAINRVIRKLDTGEEFEDIATYLLGIARMMTLEIARTRERQRVALDQPAITQSMHDESDPRAHCLEQCLAVLPQRSRELITEYYQDDGAAKIRRRRELGVRLGVGLNALRIRACRLRLKLEECMGRCLKSQSNNETFRLAAVKNEGHQ